MSMDSLDFISARLNGHIQGVCVNGVRVREAGGGRNGLPGLSLRASERGWKMRKRGSCETGWLGGRLERSAMVREGRGEREGLRWWG
ncbi:hypothetical protein V1478_008792 [Vespula squamosa]|uniref:Uncharacterized protein n=1 Tax=Vespula squamosa TaxID=30214 RepID=A0ABD2AUI0_VESSQ